MHLYDVFSGTKKPVESRSKFADELQCTIVKLCIYSRAKNYINYAVYDNICFLRESDYEKKHFPRPEIWDF